LKKTGDRSVAKLIALVITVIAIVAGIVVGIGEGAYEGFMTGALIWAFFGGLEFAVISFSQQRSLEQLRQDIEKLKKETSPQD